MAQRNVGRVEMEVKSETGKLEKRTLTIPDPISGCASGENEKTVAVDALIPNELGIYHLAGNVKEIIRERGFSKGGGWGDPGYYLMTNVHQTYDTNEVAADRGFRIVMEMEE